MIKVYKIRLYPTAAQKSKIIDFCNASRYAYNWALATEIQAYENEEKFISGYELTKLFTEFKKQEGNEWLKDISARALKMAILNCADAYKNFFKHKNGFPKFKRKGKAKMICATHEQTTLIEPKRIRLEKLGWVKCHTNDIPSGINYNPKISYDGINFWFTVGKEVEISLNEKQKTEVIGIDLGLKTLAVCSNGIELKKPNVKKLQKRLKRLQRKASRQYQPMIDYCKKTKTKFNTLQKSKNLLKLEKQIKSLHIRIENILTTNIHQFTKNIVDLNPKAIVIEDLNVSGMRKCRSIARAINEAKFYEIRRQLEYKCKWYQVELVIADRFYPSSKTCSNCGTIKKDLKLKDRIYRCECGLAIDRDLNASYNLKNLVS